MYYKLLKFEVVYVTCKGARGSLVIKALGYKTGGRGFEIHWGKIVNLLNPSGDTRLWSLHSVWQKWVPETKIILLGSKVRLVRGADNLTTIYEPIV
jgi:hypothetical protein